jgi:hypothetical protein
MNKRNHTVKFRILKDKSSLRKGILFAGIATLVGIFITAVSLASAPTARASLASYCTPARAVASGSSGGCLATIANFNAAGNQVTKFDTTATGIDAHDGDLKFFQGKYYLYGTSYNCGYQLGVPYSPFCGFKSYSSTDLVNWSDNGGLFDAQTPHWQLSCAPPRYGCYRPHVLYNAGTKKYVLWVNGYDNASGFHVLTSSSPQGPFVEQSEPTVANMGSASGGYVNGDFNLFEDDNGVAYINYTFINFPTPVGQHNHQLKVEKLNFSFTSGSGTAATPGPSSVEAPSMFKKDGLYYMVYGPDCAYCGGTATLYITASSPLGNWSTPTLINPTSCGGQPSFVATLPTPSGKSIYVYGSDLWRVEPGKGQIRNQALANYFFTPLNFGTSSIDKFSCDPNVSIPTMSTSVSPPGPKPGIDQSSGVTSFRTWCDISANWSRGQSFKAGKSGKLITISVTTFQEGSPNADLGLSIYHASASGTPIGAALYHGSVPPSYIGWSPVNFIAAPNINVVAGQEYVVVAATKTSTGCYGWEYSDSNPYLSGTEYYQNPGHAPITEIGRDLKFSTIVQ